MSLKRLALALLVWWSLWVHDSERGWVIRSLHAAYETCELAAWSEGHLAPWYTPEQMDGLSKLIGITYVKMPVEPAWRPSWGPKPPPLPPPRPYSGCWPVQATHMG